MAFLAASNKEVLDMIKDAQWWKGSPLANYYSHQLEELVKQGLVVETDHVCNAGTYRVYKVK